MQNTLTGKIMYAYVKYTADGFKTIIPVNYIKSFLAEKHRADILYQILWEGKYYNGQVLLIKDTREELLDCVNDPTTRIRVPKIKDAMDQDDSSETPELKSSKKNNKNQKAIEEEQQKKNLAAILAEKKALKKKSPLFPPLKKSKKDKERSPQISEESDFDDGAIVPEEIHNELKAKYMKTKKELLDLRKEMEQTMQKCTEYKLKTQELEKELKVYKRANLSLQGNLDEVLQRAFANNPQFLSQPACTETVSQQASPHSLPPKSWSQPDTKTASLEKRNGKINIGPDLWVSEDVWSRISCATKDSIFVKELAVAIWGTANLKGRSVSGKECPTKQAEAKPPLTPAKLGILKEIFRRRLDHMNLEPVEKEKRMKQVGHYLTEKIMDINKKEKKKRNDLFMLN